MHSLAQDSLGSKAQWGDFCSLKTGFFLDPFFEAIVFKGTRFRGMNYRKSCFGKIFVLCSPNLMVSREEPRVGSRLTLLITGICDLGKSLARGSKGRPVPGSERRGGVGRDPEEGESCGFISSSLVREGEQTRDGPLGQVQKLHHGRPQGLKEVCGLLEVIRFTG